MTLLLLVAAAAALALVLRAGPPPGSTPISEAVPAESKPGESKPPPDPADLIDAAHDDIIKESNSAPDDEADETDQTPEPQGAAAPNPTPPPPTGAGGKDGAPEGTPTPPDAPAEPEGGAPAPAQTPTPPAPQGADLSAEDAALLSRTRATPEEIETYRSMTPAARRLALEPVRRAQHKLNTIYGMSKEERERAIDQESGRSTPPAPQTPPAAPPAKVKVKLNPEKLARIARDNGLKAEDLSELVDDIADAVGGAVSEQHSTRIQGLEKQLADEREATHKRALDAAARQAEATTTRVRDQLKTRFPKLADHAELRGIMETKQFQALFGAHIEDGKDMEEALREALETVATRRYFKDLTTPPAPPPPKPPSGAATRTGGAKPPVVPARQGPMDVDAAHEEVLAGR